MAQKVVGLGLWFLEENRKFYLVPLSCNTVSDGSKFRGNDFQGLPRSPSTISGAPPEFRITRKGSNASSGKKRRYAIFFYEELANL